MHHKDWYYIVKLAGIDSKFGKSCRQVVAALSNKTHGTPPSDTSLSIKIWMISSTWIICVGVRIVMLPLKILCVPYLVWVKAIGQFIVVWFVLQPSQIDVSWYIMWTIWVKVSIFFVNAPIWAANIDTPSIFWILAIFLDVYLSNGYIANFYYFFIKVISIISLHLYHWSTYWSIDWYSGNKLK